MVIPESDGVAELMVLFTDYCRRTPLVVGRNAVSAKVPPRSQSNVNGFELQPTRD